MDNISVSQREELQATMNEEFDTYGRFRRERLPLDSADLSPEMVKAVLAELLNEHDGAQFGGSEVEWHVRTEGYGLVGSQLARRALVHGMGWRDWIARVLHVLPSGAGDIRGMAARASIRGIIDALQSGTLDVNDEEDRDAVIDQLGYIAERSGYDLPAHLLYVLARGVARLVNWEGREKTAWAAENPRHEQLRRVNMLATVEEVARDLVSEMKGGGLEVEAFAFLGILRELTRVKRLAVSSGADLQNRVEVPV